MTVPPNKEFAEEITVTKELLSKIKKDNPNTKYKIGEFLNVEDIIKYTSITE